MIFEFKVTEAHLDRLGVSGKWGFDELNADDYVQGRSNGGTIDRKMRLPANLLWPKKEHKRGNNTVSAAGCAYATSYDAIGETDDTSGATGNVTVNVEPFPMAL